MLLFGPRSMTLDCPLLFILINFQYAKANWWEDVLMIVWWLPWSYWFFFFSSHNWLKQSFDYSWPNQLTTILQLQCSIVRSRKDSKKSCDEQTGLFSYNNNNILCYDLFSIIHHFALCHMHYVFPASLASLLRDQN